MGILDDLDVRSSALQSSSLSIKRAVSDNITSNDSDDSDSDACRRLWLHVLDHPSPFHSVSHSCYIHTLTGIRKDTRKFQIPARPSTKKHPTKLKYASSSEHWQASQRWPDALFRPRKNAIQGYMIRNSGMLE